MGTSNVPVGILVPYAVVEHFGASREDFMAFLNLLPRQGKCRICKADQPYMLWHSVRHHTTIDSTVVAVFCCVACNAQTVTVPRDKLEYSFDRMIAIGMRHMAEIAEWEEENSLNV